MRPAIQRLMGSRKKKETVRSRSHRDELGEENNKPSDRLHTGIDMERGSSLNWDVQPKRQIPSAELL